MRIVTWNIQWGLGMNGRVDLPGIVRHARELADFDALCLQEISDGMPDLPDSGGANQFAGLAELLPGYRAIGGAGLEIFDDTGRRRRFGNMILTRFPVRQVVRHTLPWLGGGERSMPRMLLDTLVRTPFGLVRLATTHLEYSSGEARAAQIAAIRDIHATACDRVARPRQAGSGPYSLVEGSCSAILTGDFNMKPDDPTRRRLSEPAGAGVPRLVDTWEAMHAGVPHPASFCITDQTYGPAHCCDYIYVSEDLVPRLRSVSYDTETRLSDHQPVVVTLEGS